ncbi:MAG: hypothetical protein JSR59_02665 [Proteobacteria bacterium]|nr:hypothetical protein [Pseudomonadota bacterium]
MNLIPAWLRTLHPRNRRPMPPDTDPADMGTTFGLEAALPGLTDASRQELQCLRLEELEPDSRYTRPARL